jgi:hypothetical protein
MKYTLLVNTTTNVQTSIAHDDVLWTCKRDRSLVMIKLSDMSSEHIANCLNVCIKNTIDIESVKTHMSDTAFNVWFENKERFNNNKQFTYRSWILLFENELAYRKDKVEFEMLKYQLIDCENKKVEILSTLDTLKSKAEKKQERKALKAEYSKQLDKLLEEISVLNETQSKLICKMNSY